MEPIVTVQEAVTAFAEWLEPTAAELDAIEREMPLITAQVDELDVADLLHGPPAHRAGRAPSAPGP